MESTPYDERLLKKIGKMINEITFNAVVFAVYYCRFEFVF